jgi:hypothetical protein
MSSLVTPLSWGWTKPFSVICQGHPNTKDALVCGQDGCGGIRNSALSMEDASMFKTKDGRFLTPTDRLTNYGPTPALLGVYMGPGSDLSVALTNGLTEICPS